MSLSTSTLRPGLLVSLKTSIKGGVTYQKQVIEPEHIVDGQVQKAKWETTRTINNAAEHEAASKARSKARSLISGVCAASAFGYLCPEADADRLEAAIAEARKVADEFNATAELTRVSVYVITGRVAPDDVEAVKAINSEVKDLLADMADGIAKLDVKVIRDAASRAKSIGEMLSGDAQARVQIAVEAAREAAKKIVKAGEAAAVEIDQRAIRKITEARTAFLDLDEQSDVAAPAADARAIDFAPELAPASIQPARPQAAQIEL